MPSGSASHRRVEPSTSVNRNVTTPDGAFAADTRKGCHTCHHGGVTTAIIVVIVVLLALGIVINQLFRLRDWLKNSPPLPPPTDDDAED